MWHVWGKENLTERDHLQLPAVDRRIYYTLNTKIKVTYICVCVCVYIYTHTLLKKIYSRCTVWAVPKVVHI
jgi:hypothetical protein